MCIFVTQCSSHMKALSQKSTILCSKGIKESAFEYLQHFLFTTRLFYGDVSNVIVCCKVIKRSAFLAIWYFFMMISPMWCVGMMPSCNKLTPRWRNWKVLRQVLKVIWAPAWVAPSSFLSTLKVPSGMKIWP